MRIEIETASVTDKGLNPLYLVNEDSYLVLEKERVFAVADGVGGAHAGDVASQSALGTIKNMALNVKQNAKTLHDDSISFLKNLISAGNTVIYNESKRKQQQMASTIAIMVIEDDYAILGHVGDSRIYVHRGRNLIQLTRDHSRLQALIDSSSLKLTNEIDYQDRHIITKALGVEPSVEPDIQKVILKNNDIFILCTDGIYTHNSNSEILDNISRNRHDLKKACEEFKDKCYQKGAKDNLTAIVLRIEKKDDDETITKRLKTTHDMINTTVKK
ncbi:MAG: PP2C family protein-serine/threonine phosphatase [bacterium]